MSKCNGLYFLSGAMRSVKLMDMIVHSMV